MKNAIILGCKCAHSAQDKLHGRQMRVHSRTTRGKPGSPPVWRCTVCLSEREAKE